MNTLYQDLLMANVPTDSHASDLYVKDTPEARRILQDHGKPLTGLFRNNIDGLLWFDVPFMYAPWWEARCS